MKTEQFGWIIPLALVVVIIELTHLRSRGKAVDWDDTFANINTALLNVIVKGMCRGVFFIPYVWSYETLRLMDLPTGWGSFAVTLLLVDLNYYFYHRVSHMGALWAVHAPHHSSNFFNLGTGVRQGAFSPIFKSLFYVPLALGGIRPEWVLGAELIVILSQFPLHTETVGRLPRIVEFVFNTPSNHRVHHGKNPEYIDKNFGGILMLWDRLFGTYQREETPVEYGTLESYPTSNAFLINLLPWKYLAQSSGKSHGRVEVRGGGESFVLKAALQSVILLGASLFFYNFGDYSVAEGWSFVGVLLAGMLLLGVYTDGNSNSALTSNATEGDRCDTQVARNILLREPA